MSMQWDQAERIAALEAMLEQWVKWSRDTARDCRNDPADWDKMDELTVEARRLLDS